MSNLNSSGQFWGPVNCSGCSSDVKFVRLWQGKRRCRWLWCQWCLCMWRCSYLWMHMYRWLQGIKSECDWNSNRRCVAWSQFDRWYQFWMPLTYETIWKRALCKKMQEIHEWKHPKQRHESICRCPGGTSEEMACSHRIIGGRLEKYDRSLATYNAGSDNQRMLTLYQEVLEWYRNKVQQRSNLSLTWQQNNNQRER